MKHPARPGGSPGFTLIELLTVIAIIGILAAIVIPTIGHVRETAQRAVDASNLREILKASLAYATEHDGRLPDPAGLASRFPDVPPVFRIPASLARSGALADPTVYFAKNDPLFPGDYPAAILDPDSTARNTLAPDFGTDRVLAWEFVGGLTLDDPPATPIAYTRGLRPDGTWDPTSGVYGDKGGFIATLGGSVTFHEDVTSALRSNASPRAVSDVREAIPYRNGAPARLYGTPPATGTLLGSPTGTAATPGP